MKSLGVINGRAADLVKPVYSAAAKAVNAQGTVEVQVMIDEAGKVVSAHAISGNALLRPRPKWPPAVQNLHRRCSQRTNKGHGRYRLQFH